jgi:hypothetical protein
MRGEKNYNFIIPTFAILILAITIIPTFNAYGEIPTIATIVHPLIPHDENRVTFDTWQAFPETRDKANVTSSNDGDTSYIFRASDSKWQTFVMEDATVTAAEPLENAIPADSEITSVTLYAWVKNIGTIDGKVSLGCETGKSNKNIYKSEDKVISPSNPEDPKYVLIDWKMEQNPATKPIRNWTSTDFGDWIIDGKQLACGIENQDRQNAAPILVTEFWAEIERPVDPVPKITFSPLDDNGKLGINELGKITVQDPYANRNGNVDSIQLFINSSARTLADSAELILTLNATDADPNKFEIQFVPTTGPTTSDEAIAILHADHGSTILAQTPYPVEARTATEVTSATNNPIRTAAGGGAVTSPALEFENDVYQMGQGVLIKANVPGCTEPTRTVHVWAPAGDAAGFPVTLTDTDGDCKYVSPNLLRLDATSSDPTIPQLKAANWNFIAVKWPATGTLQHFANAFVIPIATATPTGGVVLDASQQIAVSCEEGEDDDNDGLCDSWETNTGLRIPYNGVEYHYPCGPLINDRGGALTTGPSVCPSPNHKDIYIEMDYMFNHKPVQNTLIIVRDTFLNAPDVDNPDGLPGVNLHMFIDENTFDHDQFLSNDEFYQTKQAKFGTSTERTSSDIIHAKRQGFHWMYFAHQQEAPQQLSSGYAEVGGNDALITMGAFAGHTGTNKQQAATIIHELGHNLHLNHGGSATNLQNCKPQYISVMNYLYQFNIWTPTNAIDLSRHQNVDIDENNPNESVGMLADPSGQKAVYGPSPLQTVTLNADTPIDWDRSGDAGQSQTNINLIPLSGCQNDDGYDDHVLLTGFNDWEGMVLPFRENAGFADGVSSLDPNNPDNPNLTQGNIEATSGVIPQLSNERPIADAGPTIIEDEGEVIQLISYNNSDPDGIDLSNDSQPCGVMWNIDNDDVFDGFNDACGSPSPLWLEDDENNLGNGTGLFNVGLRLNDMAGDQSAEDDLLDIIIRNVAPIVNAGSDHSIDEGQFITLPDATWEDPGLNDTHDSATIFWGDGDAQPGILSITFTGAPPVFDPPTPTSPITGTVLGDTHQYLDDCLCNLTVSVHDDDGGIGNGTVTVTVSNVAPVVSGGGSTADTLEGSPMSFNNVTFTDVGILDTHTATIDYGDGTTTIPVAVTSPFAISNHTYSSSGTFTVNATVTDDDGGVGFVSFDVTVLNSPPTVTLDQPIPGTEEPILYGETIIISGTIEDSSENFTINIDWSGNNLEPDIESTSNISISHTYLETSPDGTLSLTIEVCDSGDPPACVTLGPFTIEVFYVFGGWNSPVPGSVYELGRTIPVKGEILDVNLQPVDNVLAEVFWNSTDGVLHPAETKNSRQGNIAVFKQGVYQINMLTDGPNAGPMPLGPITIVMKLDDGTQHSQTIEIK